MLCTFKQACIFKHQSILIWYCPVLYLSHYLLVHCHKCIPFTTGYSYFILGVMNDDYKSLMNIDTQCEGLNAYSATGISTTVIASRVSYVFNLHGPCMVVDTACSSALVAIHLGSQAIRAGKHNTYPLLFSFSVKYPTLTSRALWNMKTHT